MDIVGCSRQTTAVTQISTTSPCSSTSGDPRLIALDWGTTSARAYLLDDTGRILRTGPAGRGILTVTERATSAEDHCAAFEEEFERMCGSWLDEHPEMPVLASGMVGSNQGWVDVPYQRLPKNLTSLADALVEVPSQRGRVHIVPGLLDDGELPQVMRGEETQILGVLERTAAVDGGDGPTERVIVLPGTHTKWVRVQGVDVVDFLTSMTGEIYGLLTQHSILAHLASQPEAPDLGAFDRGVQTSLETGPEGGILASLFTARTLPLTGRMPAEQVNDYISGLMIGAEVASCVASWLSTGFDTPSAQVLLCGEPELCRRYQRTLQQFDVDALVVAGDVVTHGLWRIALSAGLLEHQLKGKA